MCFFRHVISFLQGVTGIQLEVKKIVFYSPLLLLIKSYLTNRYLQSQYKTSTSRIAKIIAGVPQEDVLSPFLFNI